MKWLNNIKISVRILAGFILVAFIAGVIGVTGIININKIDKLDTELYKKMTAPFSELVGVTNDYKDMKIYVREVLVAKEQIEIEQYETKFNDSNANFEKNIKVFEETILTEAGRKMTQEMKDFKDDYVLIGSQIIALTKGGKNEEALNLLHTEEIKISNQVDFKLKEMTDTKIRLAKEAAEANNSTATKATFTTIIFIVIGMALAIIMGIIISLSISRPISNLMSLAHKVADGNLDVTVTIDTKDEIGTLAKAFRKMADNLNEVMGNINIAADQVSTGSRQVSDSSMALSQGATEQASSIEELTASVEEISSQTRLNADNANEANKLAETAKENAAEGNIQMKEMQKAMEEINESSRGISKIIKVIDEIAFQTNILALNAAVEAARAGQHGKGFAVVAEEVRNLAARSANAAKETTAMIEGSIKKVEGGTRIANETSEALKKIVEGVEKAANLVADIALASSEQAVGVEQINQGIIQVSTVVQTNSATSEESAAASEELSSQAELLKKQVLRFTLRKDNRSTSSYAGVNGISPEILRMIEDLSNKKQNAHGSYDGGRTSRPTKIDLGDNEFGKY